jgi:flagellar biosynthesis/type III secretory pathway M-ring protein FliF/YscJ
MKNRFISSSIQASYTAVLIILFILATPVFSSFGENENDPTSAREVNQVRNKSEIRHLMDRVLEIKGIDRSTLNQDERESLKSELRLIKTDLQKSNREQKTNKLGGIYISVGGIILILLILLIIL